MATAIICILLILICVLTVVSYRKRLSQGCCGSGGDTVEKQGPADKDLSHYPYTYKVEIEGMTCKNCASRVENAFHTAGDFYAKVNLNKKTALVRAKTETPEDMLKKIIIRTGYDVISVQQEGVSN